MKRLLALILLGWFTVVGGANVIRIVTSPSLQYDYLTTADVRDIYALQTLIDDIGNPITIIHMNRYSHEYDHFVENFLYMSLRSYRHLIESRRARGDIVYIKYANSNFEVLELVKSIPSSIGYIDSTIYINTGPLNEINIINLPTY